MSFKILVYLNAYSHQKGSFEFGIFTYIFPQQLVVTYVYKLDIIAGSTYILYVITEQVF